MSSSTFDRETILDLMVNVIPLGIILFFMAMVAVINPFGWDGLVSTLQFSIMGITGILLVILTYYAGKAISEAEAEMEAKEHAAADSGQAEAELEDEAAA